MVSEDFSTYMVLHYDFDCLYLDLAKAFDRVSHHKLIKKNYNIDIQGNLLLSLDARADRRWLAF